MNNLNNLSDDELDKLFRQSAEESEVEFDERAWQKMNSLLNEKQILSKNWRKYSLIILAILFLGSTALYFGNENGLFNNLQKGEDKVTQKNKNIENNTIINSKIIDDKINENTYNKTEKPLEILDEKESKIVDNESVNKVENSNLEKDNSETSSKKLKTRISKNEKINGNLNNSTKAKILTAEPKLSYKTEKLNEIKKDDIVAISNPESNITIKKNQSKSFPKTVSEPNEKFIENGRFDLENSTVKNSISPKNNKSEIAERSNKSKSHKNQNNQNNSTIANNIRLNNAIVAKNNFENEGSKVIDNQKTASLIEVAEPFIGMTYFQNISLNYLLSKTAYNYKKPVFEVEVSPLELDLPEPKKVEFYKKGLAIRLAISPDISTISSNKISKIGSNIGGLLEYRFSNKLSVQAGVFRSMKYYDAMPDQYTWVWGYSHDKLVDINAQCKMMDYPVNIRYDFLAKGTTRIFVGVGATTYKMMNEKYHYNYVNNYSPTIKHRDWSGKTGTYLTSNLNLSIGLEKYISKNFTIQVEPFAKSPLKSIGFGKVPLLTYGMMISGKYPLTTLIKK